jgi:hypothetical protein
MNKKVSAMNDSRFLEKFTKYTLFVTIIVGVGFSVRFYFFPYDIPLTADALYYFWYSSDIFLIRNLPQDWSPGNNGWPILVGGVFSLLNTNDIFTLMQSQRLLSLVLSMSTAIPVYFLCKKFVSRKFAIVGVALIAFDPRLMVNSFLGVTDPLFLLLISTSLTIFLYSNKKTIYIAFVLAAFATLVRSEGLAIFLVLSIVFFIKFRNEKYRLILKYSLILLIFVLILLPLSLYRIEVTGNDYLFQRGLTHIDKIKTNISSDEGSNNNIVNGLETFGKYLIWVLIPNFIIFIPLGLFLIFKKINSDKLTIILSLGILSLPALYGYTLSAFDTRYLYVLFPLFSVLSVLAIEKITSKLSRQNLIIIIIILIIISSSMVFYNYLKIDYEHEEESFRIMKEISSLVGGINEFSPESRYMYTISTIDQWPNTYKNMKFDTDVIEYDADSLENYILDSKNKGLTHLIVDQSEKRPKEIQELFINEGKFDYLKRIYDSKNEGFNYHVKVFKINYELMNEK